MSLSIVAAIFAALVIYQGIDWLRWGKGRRSWLWLGCAPPLLVLAGLLFWHSVRHPSPAEPLAANAGFGPDWDCSAMGQGDLVACAIRSARRRRRASGRRHERRSAGRSQGLLQQPLSGLPGRD
jgi:hypothetical protein